MTNLTPEMVAKAKAAKTPEELLELAKEAGMEDFTAESAAAYFNQFHPTTDELSDDELENVAGGGCHKGNELVVSALHTCKYWVCVHCDEAALESKNDHDIFSRHVCFDGNYPYMNCTKCRFCRYNGMWLCDESAAKAEAQRRRLI